MKGEKMEEDKEMYQEFLNGNQEAFDRLMEKYQAKLIYFTKDMSEQ